MANVMNYVRILISHSRGLYNTNKLIHPRSKAFLAMHTRVATSLIYIGTYMQWGKCFSYETLNW